VIKTLTKFQVCFATLMLLSVCATKVAAQVPALNVGLRFQKTLDLYFENGVTVLYSSPKLLHDHLRLGVNYVSSRLGSAIASNAIRQDNAFVSAGYLFEKGRKIRPGISVNAGWFHANYDSDIFEQLPQSSPTLAAEACLTLFTKAGIQIGAGIGYNLITGDGVDKPGTLYPVYAQVSLTYNILKSRQP
jgi:hypothetical protein